MGGTSLWDLLGEREGLKESLTQGGLWHLGLGFEEERRLETSLWRHVARLLSSDSDLTALQQ